MPVEWRLHVLEEKIRREVGGPFTIERLDLYGLPPLEQHEAIDAIMKAGGDFPVVLVDGTVACIGDIDADAIVRAVSRLSRGERPEAVRLNDSTPPKPSGGCGCGGGCC